jgi:hypothetical protein
MNPLFEWLLVGMGILFPVMVIVGIRSQSPAGIAISVSGYVAYIAALVGIYG